jgi:hypothetical protein
MMMMVVNLALREIERKPRSQQRRVTRGKVAGRYTRLISYAKLQSGYRMQPHYPHYMSRKTSQTL